MLFGTYENLIASLADEPFLKNAEYADSDAGKIAAALHAKNSLTASTNLICVCLR